MIRSKNIYRGLQNNPKKQPVKLKIVKGQIKILFRSIQNNTYNCFDSLRRLPLARTII